jgi:oligopeptide/dipeptide ABC transporter ATP-binding protein
MSQERDVAEIIQVRAVSKRFKGRTGEAVHAVNGVSCAIESGETVGLIGESGSGKSTLGRMMLGLLQCDEGEIIFEGAPLAGRSREELRALRAKMQVVFQEPYQSLNPRMKVKSIIAEPLVVHRLCDGPERAKRVAEAMEQVGLSPTLAGRYPAELSGGQQQRVGIARAVVARPRFVVLDEPTASLDRTIRRQITDLLVRLQQDMGLAYLLITHDIASVRRMANRSLVMLRGNLVESGPTDRVLARPGHPYSKALISAELVPRPGVTRERYRLNPRPLGAASLTPGCPLEPVCPLAIAECSARMPEMRDIADGHYAACIRWQDLQTATPPDPGGRSSSVPPHSPLAIAAGLRPTPASGATL